MILDLFTGATKLAIAGLFIWGLHQHAEQSIEVDRTVAEEERLLRDLQLLRQDLIERRRLAEGLVGQAELILALQPAGKPASDDEAAAMRAVDGLAVGLAAGLHCQARQSMRGILEETGEASADLPTGGCEPNAGLNVIGGNRTWSHAWTEELDGMRRSVERKLSDLDRDLEWTGGRVDGLSLIGNAYIRAGAILAICMIVLQTALDLFGPGRNGRT